MQLVRRGDTEAFEVVYERHATAAFSLAYRMTGTRNVAEDVVQEAFLSASGAPARATTARAGRSARGCSGSSTTARSTRCGARWSTTGGARATRGSRSASRPRERTDVEAARRDEAREVRTALRTLPDEQSRVIELAYFGGFSQSEIAAMLDTPIGTVKGRMRLGLKKMRGELNGLAEAFA